MDILIAILKDVTVTIEVIEFVRKQPLERLPVRLIRAHWGRVSRIVRVGRTLCNHHPRVRPYGPP
jgi:hypothetical protein